MDRQLLSTRARGNADIFVVGPEGGSPRRLTSEHSSDVVPSWSRDGQWVYFASDRTGSWEVWKMPSRGGFAVRVTHHGGFASGESPDGRFLYYAKGQTVPGLWRIPTEGGQETEITSMEAGHWGYWAVVENGIYYLDTKTKPGIAFLNLDTHRASRVFDLENRPAREAPGLAVSPTKRQSCTHNSMRPVVTIILVENYR
jgi:Tol biopolymer transport system component